MHAHLSKGLAVLCIPCHSTHSSNLFGMLRLLPHKLGLRSAELPGVLCLLPGKLAAQAGGLLLHGV